MAAVAVAIVGERVMFPETAPVLAIDKTKAFVPCPETTIAPTATPVPYAYQPLQFIGVRIEVGVVLIVVLEAVPVKAKEVTVGTGIVGQRKIVPEVIVAMLIID